MVTELQLVATLLRRGRSLDRWSGAITLLALIYGLAPLLGAEANISSTLLCALLLLCGLVQKYWALRVAVDADLFAYLARASVDLDQQAAALDQALHRLGLGQASPHRDWQQRCQGAVRLLRVQSLWLAVQILLAFAVILAMPWLSLAG